MEKYNESTVPNIIGEDMAREMRRMDARTRTCAMHYYALYRNLHGEVREFIEKRWSHERNTEKNKEIIREKVTYALIAYLHALYEEHNGKTLEEDQYGQKPFI